LPAAERFGLQAQIRRAAVSVACDIVEGSAREKTTEYLNFLNIAAGSASEARYLVDVSTHLDFLDPTVGRKLVADYTILCGQLHALIASLRRKP